MNGKTTGFASPAQGYESDPIDLNSLLITNPPATYFFRLESSDMAACGLPKGSLLVVDRSLNPQPNNLVLLRHEGDFLCRQLATHNGKQVFTNGINDLVPIIDDTEVIGVITSSIKTYGGSP
jgi:SOS-response transcriptional repressor LexA